MKAKGKSQMGFFPLLHITQGLLSYLANMIVENYRKMTLIFKIIYRINYEDVKKAIQRLKSDLMRKGEAGDLFGNEKDDSFAGILGSISQTVFGELAYPSIEEQAAQLLYSIIKGHSFSDGNKRIGNLFLYGSLNKTIII